MRRSSRAKTCLLSVYHDFFTQFAKTKLYVTKKPEGYGLVCHRIVKAICEIVGIKDLHAKLEGSNNSQNIAKAFLIGLLKQVSDVSENKIKLIDQTTNNFLLTVFEFA